MKRIISLIILAVLCIGMLASCAAVDTVKGWFGGEQTTDTGLDSAVTSLHNIYKNKAKNVMSDFDVHSSINIKVDGTDVKFPVTWESDSDKVSIVNSVNSGYYTVDLPDKNEEKFNFTLTATISDANGNEVKKSYTFTLLVYDNTTVVGELKEGQAYNLGIYQASLEENYYIIGQMSGYYMATTNDVNDAVNVYVEAVDGGYKMYCIYWGEKLYINMIVTDTGYVNPSFDETATTVYTYDSTLKTLVYTIGSDSYAFGVRNDAKDDGTYYTTFGPRLLTLAESTYYVTFTESTIPDQADHGLHTPEAIINAAYALEQDDTLDGTHTLTGIIKSVDTAYDSGYKNVTVTIVVGDMTDKPIMCYRLKGTGADQIGVGDEITVTGTIVNYKGTIEFNSGCSLDSWVDNAEPEQGGTEGGEDSGETTETTYVVVDAPVAGTAYKFGMVQGNLNKTYYLAGGMAQTYYFATTEDASAAIDVYLEATEGGYYLYTLDGESKLYINMIVSGTHVNGAYETTASTVYTYDADSKTIVATVTPEGGEAAAYWFGTRNDKEYTTVGPCATSYNGFYCQFYAESESGDDTSATPTYNVVDTPKAFDGDHLCDYGCGATISKCVDANTDYECDECGKDLCYDLDNDHICDIEAHKATGEKISECVDENKDHICDFAGCKKALSECADGETVDHVCDYCGKYNSAWCADTNNNHLCDLEACGKAISECADATADHKCDKCDKDVCTDANADRFCDNCKNYIPYNFESTKIESNGNLAFSNVNYKNKEDYVSSTSVELNGTRTEGYNASTHLYLVADPNNAANVLLAAQSASGSGLTEDTISDIMFTPTTLVEGGDLVVLEFDYNLYKSGANGKNTFRWGYHYASGDVKRVNGTYTTNNNASVRLIADKDGSMKFDIGSWVRIRLVCDNTNKKIYTYLSTDNGASYTLQETVDAYAYDSTISSVDITFVGWGVSATQYFDNVKCVITTAEAYGISFE